MYLGCIYKFFGFSMPYTITSPCLFSTYQLCFLLCIHFPLFSPRPTSIPPCDVHFSYSVPVLVLCLVVFVFFLGSIVDSCEFVVILLFMFLIIFFLDKSLKKTTKPVVIGLCAVSPIMKEANFMVIQFLESKLMKQEGN